jgi:serine/threonine protein kinase
MPLLDGLEVVHKAGFTHRDVKPGNIYVREDLTPVLLDFGSARMQASELTAVVSPGYAPLEQYHTQGNQGPWSDLYALGGVLYWIVTGNRPIEAVARAREDTLPPAIRAGDLNVYGVELLAAIDWALTPNENERPQSVEEWRQALLGITDPGAVKLERAKAHAKTQLISRPPPARPPAPQAPAAPVFDPGLLKDLENRLAQHLGPIAKVVVKNASRKATTEAELVSLLAAEISEPAERTAFEKRFSEASRPASQPVSSAPLTNPATALAASRFPLEMLERLERRLAEHIGAIARVVVKRAAMKARDEAELHLLLAEEIESKDDRKTFLRQAASVSKGPPGKT